MTNTDDDLGKFILGINRSAHKMRLSHADFLAAMATAVAMEIRMAPDHIRASAVEYFCEWLRASVQDATRH